MEKITEMLKGVLEGCVLEIIGRGETYGYEITQLLRELGFTDVVEGTVYTITMRLEKNNLVNIEKKHPLWDRRENFIHSTRQVKHNERFLGKMGFHLKQN